MKRVSMLALALALGSPAFAQDDAKPKAPAQEKDGKERDKKSALVLEKEARAVFKRFVEALKANDLDKALNEFAIPFTAYHSGRAHTLKREELKKFLGKIRGKMLFFYSELGDTIFWTTEHSFGKLWATQVAAFRDCVWIGKILKNREPIPFRAKKPYALKRVNGKVKIVGYTDA